MTNKAASNNKSETIDAESVKLREHHCFDARKHNLEVCVARNENKYMNEQATSCD